jgi:hypothetical protein
MAVPLQADLRPAARHRRPFDAETITDRRARWMRGAAGLWLVVAVGGFLAAAVRGGIPRSPQRGDWEILTQVALLALVAIGGALAWRWRGLGAAVVTLAAIGLGALASLEHQPFVALMVALLVYVPGLLFWLDWQRTKPLRSLIGLAAATALALTVGGFASHRIYETYFGPVQPESSLAVAPVEAVEWIWAGGTSDQGATITAKLTRDGGDVTLLVSRWSDLSDPIVAAPRPTVGRVVSFEVGGLTADTEYWYAVAIDGRADVSRLARFRTFPVGPASYSFAFGSCSTTGSNGAVYDTIRGLDPRFFMVVGDFFYEDIAVDDPGEFRTAFDRNLTAPAQAALYRQTPVVYVWDDHDYDSNDADATATSRQAAYQVYDEVVPHYALRDGAEPPIYQAFTVGRVRFIVTDARSARSPADLPDDAGKSMLGVEQKAWFKRQLLEANGVYPVIVWVNSVPWIAEASAGADHWGGYATERRELADFIAANRIQGLMMLSGDAHMVAIDDGSNSDYSTTGGGGFPVMHAAALDRHGSAKGGPYSEGSFPGGGQFGFVTVNDGGSAVEVVLSGRNWKGEEIVTYTFTATVASVGAGATGVGRA